MEEIKRVYIRAVDSREPEEIRKPLLEMGWVQTVLKAGDYFFEGMDGIKVGIERKTVSDLVDLASTKESLQNLLIEYDCPILLIEGKWTRTSSGYIGGVYTEVTWKQVWNFLQSFQDMGIRIQLTTSSQHTVQRLNELYSYYLTEHKSALPRRAGDPRVLALCMCPGISRALAKILLEHFKTLQNISMASIEDLDKVKGIGALRARNLYKFFREGGVIEE